MTPLNQISKESKEKLYSMVGGIVCQCGNPIVIDRINDFWWKERKQSHLRLIDGMIDQKKQQLEEVRKHPMMNQRGSLLESYNRGVEDTIEQDIELLQSEKENIKNESNK